jgi:hypothetical protein
MNENTVTGQSIDAEHAGAGAGAVAIILLSFIALLGVFLFARAVTGGFQLFAGLLSVFALLMLFRVISLLYPSQH